MSTSYFQLWFSKVGYFHAYGWCCHSANIRTCLWPRILRAVSVPDKILSKYYRFILRWMNSGKISTSSFYWVLCKKAEHLVTKNWSFPPRSHGFVKWLQILLPLLSGWSSLKCLVYEINSVQMGRFTGQPYTYSKKTNPIFIVELLHERIACEPNWDSGMLWQYLCSIQLVSQSVNKSQSHYKRADWQVLNHLVNVPGYLFAHYRRIVKVLFPEIKPTSSGL